MNPVSSWPHAPGPIASRTIAAAARLICGSHFRRDSRNIFILVLLLVLLRPNFDAIKSLFFPKTCNAAEGIRYAKEKQAREETGENVQLLHKMQHLLWLLRDGAQKGGAG
jgi:hypothetical protein